MELSQTDLPDLPSYMWVVTRARTRAGKPPLKIMPFAYGYTMGKPSSIKEGGWNLKERSHHIEDCYKSLQEAVSALDSLVARELYNEQAKCNKISGRLRSSKKLAAKLVAQAI